MKRIISILAIMAVMTCSMSAQGGQPRGPQKDGAAKEQKGPDKKAVMERVKAQKIAYLTDKLDLSSQEAEKFWPVYNKVQKEQFEAMAKVREAYKAIEKALKEEAGDAELKKLIKAYDAAQDDAKKLSGSGSEAYLKVLPASKVAKLLVAEEQFRKAHMGANQGHGPQGREGMGPSKGQKGPGQKDLNSGKGQKGPGQKDSDKSKEGV